MDSSEVVKKGSMEKNSRLQDTGTVQTAMDRVDTAVKSSHDQELARLSRLPVKMEITETNNEASMSCSLIYEGSIDNENPMVETEKKAPLIVPESNTSKIKQKGQDLGVKENCMTATEKKATPFAPESNSSKLNQKEQNTSIKENRLFATEKREPLVVPESNTSKIKQKEQDTDIKENLMRVDVKKEPCVTESKPCEDIKREDNIGSEENLQAITDIKQGPPMAPIRNPENKHTETEVNHEKPSEMLVNGELYKSLITTEGKRCKNKGRKQSTGNKEKLLPMEKKNAIPLNVSRSNTYESKGIEQNTRMDEKNAIGIGLLKRDSPAATEATYSENIQRVADIGHEESILTEIEVIPELGEVTDSVDIQTTVYDSTTSIQRMLETGQNSGDKSTEISKPVCTTTTGKNSESSISSRIISAENVHGMLETGGNLDVISAGIEDPEGNPTCTSMTSNRPAPLAEDILGNLETPHPSGLSTEKDPVCTTLNLNIAELSAPRKSATDNQTEDFLKTLETAHGFELATIENDPSCTTLGLDVAGFPCSADHIQGNEETGPDSDVDVSETDPASTEVTHDNASNTASGKSYLHYMEKFNLKECSVILQKGELVDGPSENHVLTQRTSMKNIGCCVIKLSIFSSWSNYLEL